MSYWFWWLDKSKELLFFLFDIATNMECSKCLVVDPKMFLTWKCHRKKNSKSKIKGIIVNYYITIKANFYASSIGSILITFPKNRDATCYAAWMTMTLKNLVEIMSSHFELCWHQQMWACYRWFIFYPTLQLHVLWYKVTSILDAFISHVVQVANNMNETLWVTCWCSHNVDHGALVDCITIPINRDTKCISVSSEVLVHLFHVNLIVTIK